MGDQREFVRWLHEQIAEDERIARAAIQSGEMHARGKHYENWHPLRVLVECSAKREIIKLATEGFGLDARAYMHAWVESVVEGQDEPGGIANPILFALALPYADRDGYREEWRP